MWVAELDGEVVGFAAVWEADDFLHHLYVDPAGRGRGVGVALLTAATADLGERAWLKTGTHNEAARRFYTRRGWREEPLSEGVVVFRAPGPPPV